jgi:hypothetical protein
MTASTSFMVRATSSPPRQEAGSDRTLEAMPMRLQLNNAVRVISPRNIVSGLNRCPSVRSLLRLPALGPLGAARHEKTVIAFDRCVHRQMSRGPFWPRVRCFYGGNRFRFTEF